MVSICLVYAHKKYTLIKAYRPDPEPQSRLGDTRLVTENVYVRHMLITGKVCAVAAVAGGRSK